MKKNQFVIITGISGAGKTQALKCLEDLGFFCVDNIPVTLIPKFIDICEHSSKVGKIALGIDIREEDFLSSWNKLKDNFTNNNIKYKTVFLDAQNAVLIRRFSETRRTHPLMKKGRSLTKSIQIEKKILGEIHEMADFVIDTTNLTPKDLKEIIYKKFIKASNSKERLILNLLSFGYKHGIPIEADIIIDSRFLPNPYYDKDLRNFTGNDKIIKNYVLKSDVANKFIDKLDNMISFILPYFIKEGRSYLTLAVGCTGGRHRSVTIINDIKKRFSKAKNLNIQITHRDIGKPI